MDMSIILSVMICVITAMLMLCLTGRSKKETKATKENERLVCQSAKQNRRIHPFGGDQTQNIFRNNRKFDRYALYHLIVQCYLNRYCDRYISSDVYNIIYKYYCEQYIIKDFNLIKPKNGNNHYDEELALRNSFSMISNGQDKVYIFGGKYCGWYDDNFTYLNDIWEITIINDENRLSVNWKKFRTTGMQIASRTHASLLHHNNTLYLIGGVFSTKPYYEKINLGNGGWTLRELRPKVNELLYLDLNNKVNDEYMWNNIVIEPLSILKGINCAHVYKDHILVLGWSNKSKSEYVLFRISLNTYETDTININYEINSKFKDVGFDTALMNETLIIFASNNLYCINLNTYKCRKIIENLLYEIECPLLLSFGESIMIAGGGQREKMFTSSGDPPVSKQIILFDNITDINNIKEYRVDYNIQLVKHGHDLYYRMEGCVVNNLIVLFGGWGSVAFRDNSGCRFNNVYVTKFI